MGAEGIYSALRGCNLDHNHKQCPKVVKRYCPDPDQIVKSGMSSQLLPVREVASGEIPWRPEQASGGVCNGI